MRFDRFFALTMLALAGCDSGGASSSMRTGRRVMGAVLCSSRRTT